MDYHKEENENKHLTEAERYREAAKMHEQEMKSAWKTEACRYIHLCPKISTEHLRGLNPVPSVSEIIIMMISNAALMVVPDRIS